MEVIYGIGIVGFLIGVILGRYSRNKFTIGGMIFLTAILIGGPLVVMAGNGMAGLAVAIIIPAIVPPLIGYWVSLAVFSFRKRP